MSNNAADLLTLLSLLFGLPSLFLPLVFAIRSRDAWAIFGVLVLLGFGCVAFASAGKAGYADQLLGVILWLASFLLGLAACYAGHKPKQASAQKDHDYDMV